jgi:hypothetical protein
MTDGAAKDDARCARSLPMKQAPLSSIDQGGGKAAITQCFDSNQCLQSLGMKFSFTSVY